MSYQAYPPPGHQAPYGYPPAPAQSGGNQYQFHAAPPIQSYAPPPPAPLSPSEQFRSYYANRLRDLVFNSRPIIQELSLTAMQQRDSGQWEFMKIIVDEIEAAVYRAHPDAKLPILYLVDSISKNVGRPFTNQLLPPVMPRMYISAYRQVNGTTRSKMEEMISLWRTSGPDRTDLYGVGVREQIEQAIFGSTGPTPTRATVLQTVHSTLQAKQHESVTRPWDETPRHQIGVLQQIAQLLSTTPVSPQELQDIMNQIAPMNAPPAPTPVHQPPTPIPQAPPMMYGAPPPTLSVRPPAPTLPPFPPGMSRDGYSGPGGMAPPMSMMPTPSQATHSPVPTISTPLQHPAVPTPKPAVQMTGIPANVADILRNLNTSGLLSNPGTPSQIVPPPEIKQKSGLDMYEEMILNLDIRLEAMDLNRMDALPTSHLPQRCKQCGIRFPDGDAKMQLHLDWHFRRNRKERESEGRGAHRRWLPKADEWINDFGNSENEAGPSNSGNTANPASAQLPAEKLATYRKKWVRVPTDSTKNKLPCPICKEAFKAEWSEEEEEWIWRDAADVNGVIYHATCRAEQMYARKMQKMLNPDGRRTNSKSPRLTPQPETTVKVEQAAVSSSPMKNGVVAPADSSLSAANVVKRKAEEGHGADQSELKRVKVEPAEGGGLEIAGSSDALGGVTANPISSGVDDIQVEVEQTTNPGPEGGHSHVPSAVANNEMQGDTTTINGDSTNTIPSSSQNYNSVPDSALNDSQPENPIPEVSVDNTVLQNVAPVLDDMPVTPLTSTEPIDLGGPTAEATNGVTIDTQPIVDIAQSPGIAASIPALPIVQDVVDDEDALLYGDGTSGAA